MKNFFELCGRFVAGRPVLTLCGALAVTAVAVVGLSLTVEQADEAEAFVPDTSEVIDATVELVHAFPDSVGMEAIQVVMRGGVLTPEGVADSVRVTREVANAEVLADFVVDDRRPTSPGHIVSLLLASRHDNPASFSPADVTQQAIDDLLANESNDPVLAEQLRLLDSLVARDATGAVVGGIGVVTVRAVSELDRLEAAQLAVDDLVKAVPLDGLDSARTYSNGKAQAEKEESSAASLALLMAIAFAVIAALLVVFFRRVSDVVLSLGGLVVTVVWALGFQGLLGPDGLGVIGAPSVLGQMVPVMMIGLCVDYGIQGVSRYRESVAAAGTAAESAYPESAEGLAGSGTATEAMSRAVSALMLPLGLAGVTTIISFLTNLFGGISGLADFGVVAGTGVASGLIVFLTAVPAARLVLDRRAEARGKPLATASMERAIPGAGAVVERIGTAAVRRPAVILAAAGVVTVVFGVLASNLSSSFNSNDFLPDGTETKEDALFVEEFLGGNSEPVTVLVEADITDRTLRNILDFSAAIEDPLRRPAAVSSEVTASLAVFFESLPAETQSEIRSLTLDNPAALLTSDRIIDEALAIMRAADPEGFDAVVSFGADGDVDRTLIQFNALTGQSERTQELFDRVDELWLGADGDVTPIAREIISLDITNALTDSQGASIALTLLAALAVLVVFFWVTEFRPMLAVLATFPILLVLIWVMGSMVLLGYSYNVVTALITALSIGIGVDYTIHITHRFLEEHESGGDLTAAVDATMRTTGGALIGSALTTALGFAVLVFSPIPSMGQFGLLTALTVAYSLVAAVVVLPPMLVIWAAYHRWRAGALTKH